MYFNLLFKVKTLRKKTWRLKLNWLVSFLFYHVVDLNLLMNTYDEFIEIEWKMLHSMCASIEKEMLVNFLLGTKELKSRA